LNWLLRWDRRRRLRPVAIQSAKGEGLLAELDRDRRLESWHLVLPDGQIRSAGAGAIAVTALLPFGKPISWLLGRFPRATELAYTAIADNRNRISRLLRIDATCEVRR